MIELKDVSKQYTRKNVGGSQEITHAVRQLSLSLHPDVCYALVGESGSGKSTLARLLMTIESPTSGEVWLDGINVKTMRSWELRQKRAEYQMVLQNARNSLDPRQRVYDSIAEPIRCLTKLNRYEERKQILALTERMQLTAEQLNRLPYELSGGQLKRVCLARAMSISPKFIVFDEAVSGLDVTIRKEVLDLILQLRNDGLAGFLFITHDIDVAFYMADDILVMKDGEIVEKVESAYSYTDFKHAYSRLLIESLPPKCPKAVDDKTNGYVSSLNEERIFAETSLHN